MKKNIFLMLLTALTFTVGSCGSDSEELKPESVDQRFKPGSDDRPTTWTAPDYSQFEYRMAVQVQLGDTLAAFQSSGDLMCAQNDGEVRAVTSPQITGGVVYYPLLIAGHGDEQTISLYYYCERLHRIYTITNWATFDATAAPTGYSGFYRPQFLKALL